MSKVFTLSQLTCALAALSLTSLAGAAGLDRSGQDFTAFLQNGVYAEVAYTYIDADVSGYDNAYVGTDKKAYTKGNEVDNIVESYDFFRYGVKADINDTFSVGVLYDEPFGAAALYSGDNNFVSQGDRDAVVNKLTTSSGATVPSYAMAKTIQQTLASIPAANRTPVQNAQLAGVTAAIRVADADSLDKDKGTNVEVRSESITGIVGAKFGNNKEFQVYGGPVAQRLRADLTVQGTGYGGLNGYGLNVNPDQDYGWLAGVSYSKPEIALQAALTYRSEIDHKMTASEVLPAAAAAQTDILEITTPKSVNLDFQTGINPTTLATAKVRWVPWGDFAISPQLLGQASKSAEFPNGLPLIEYSDDAWVVELGLAKRLSPALAVSGNVGWDSGAGDPASSLGPVDGYYSVGLGAKYNLNPNWAVSAGGKYLWFGDAKGQLSSKTIVSDFEDNNGYVVGVKLSYQAKQKFN